MEEALIQFSKSAEASARGSLVQKGIRSAKRAFLRGSCLLPILLLFHGPDKPVSPPTEQIFCPKDDRQSLKAF
jgi:hypothetical protein